MSKLFRKPSINRVLGITKAKMDIKRSLGVYEVTKVLNAPKNAERRFYRKHPIFNLLIKLFKTIIK